MFVVFVLGLSLNWLKCKRSLLSQKASGGSLPSQPEALTQTTSLVEFENLPHPVLGLPESLRCLRVFRMTGSPSVNAKWPFHQESWKESSRSIQRVAKARGCQHLDIRRALVWHMNLWVELGFRGVHEHVSSGRSLPDYSNDCFDLLFDASCATMHQFCHISNNHFCLTWSYELIWLTLKEVIQHLCFLVLTK